MRKTKLLKINCQKCKKERIVNAHGMLEKTYLKHYPFCRKCGALNAKDKISKGWFKKGYIPWNKDTKGIMKANSGSIKHGEHRSVKTEFKSTDVSGEKNVNWKGNSVGYSALHSWLLRQKGLAKKCELCEQTKGKIEWHNLSLEYKRDLDDWEAQCSKCHAHSHKKGWIKRWGLSC